LEQLILATRNDHGLLWLESIVLLS